MNGTALGFRGLAATAAILLALSGCSDKKDTVDVNPGKGDDGVGNVKPGDQGDQGSGDGG